MAIEALSWLELKKMSTRAALQKATSQLQIGDKRALGIAYRQVFETVRRLALLDSVAESVVGPDKYAVLPLGTKAFLRILVYEAAIAHRDRGDLQRWIDAARDILGEETLRPVEPSLGRLISNDVREAFRTLSEAKRANLHLHAPAWFATYLYGLLGRTEALAFLEGLSVAPPRYVRLNSLTGSVAGVPGNLPASSLQPVEGLGLKGLYLPRVDGRSDLSERALAQGLVYAEDLSTAYAIENLGVEETELVLDACGTPGAKTAHIAELMGNHGLICTVSLRKRRAKAWVQEMRRMGVMNASIVVASAGHRMPVEGEFDAVLVNPPSSGIGAWGRDPAAKWTSSPSAISAFASVQRATLTNCLGSVRTQGVLFYLTHTITVEENEQNILHVLRHHPEFRLSELRPQLGSDGLYGLANCRRLYPHRDRCYGSFLARLVREG